MRKKRWQGRGGTITWEKVNFSKDETYAEIRGYTLNARESILKVDTVALTTPYFEEPILGRLKDKTLFNLKLGESSPIFNSFEKRLKIKIGESTKDNKFYLKDEMECLAACNGAPMMQVNHINYENLTTEKVDKILDEIAND